MALDPGLGFGKRFQHNLQIIARLAAFQKFGLPVCFGASRKGFIGKIIGREVGQSLSGSLAMVSIALAQKGAQIVRVHDVAATRDVVMVWDAVRSLRGDFLAKQISTALRSTGNAGPGADRHSGVAAVCVSALPGQDLRAGSSLSRGLGLVVVGLFLSLQVVIACLDLTELATVLDYLLTTVLVGLLVIFQPELRRGLVMLGRANVWHVWKPAEHAVGRSAGRCCGRPGQ